METKFQTLVEPSTADISKHAVYKIQQATKINQNILKMRHRIAVWSGKGGVGKTTFAIHLAYMLSEKYKTGLLDADVDCPNVFAAMHILEPVRTEGKFLLPIRKNNIEVVSMGGIAQKAVLWRGPIISGVVSQFLSQVKWDVEALIADLPPGTSDSPITIAQQLKPTSVIIVTTSEELALFDARKSIEFCQHLRLPLLGVVENMAGDIFGNGSAGELSREFKIPFLGSLPLDKKIIVYTKQGTPLHKTEFGNVFTNIMQHLLND